LTGSIFGGFIFDRHPLRGNEILGYLLIGSAITQAIVPLLSSIYLLAMVVGLEGFANGAMDPIVSACLMYLYRENLGPYM
jgi:MFS family permease